MTHSIGAHQPNPANPLATFNYLQAHLAHPVTHRLNQDHGSTELDVLYAPYQIISNDIVRERGDVECKNFETRVFDGAGYNEEAWARRLKVPLLFLFGNQAR